MFTIINYFFSFVSFGGVETKNQEGYNYTRLVGLTGKTYLSYILNFAEIFYSISCIGNIVILCYFLYYRITFYDFVIHLIRGDSHAKI